MSTNYIPKKNQLEFLNWEFGIFFHFGIRTFYEGHQDWDMKEMPLDAFNPAELDCDQWLKAVKDSGAKYAVLVCKHHDGFANWPSKYTDYTVANTPWKNGRGDVVKEFTDSCRKFGIKVGLYYSPAQFGSNEMDAKEYDDYFINQIGELLTGYGKIDYLWFDGCGSHGHKYDTKRIIKEIRRMQPDILLFNLWEPDVRWVGNETGIARLRNPNNVVFSDLAEDCIDHDYFGDGYFLPAECDCCMRDQWFYSDRNEGAVRTPDELMGLYYYSVGRGANLLLNIGPDRKGLLPQIEVDRIVEMGKEIKRRFEECRLKIAEIKKITDSSGNSVHQITLSESSLVNHVVLAENLTTGDHVAKFKVMASPDINGTAYTVYEGYTIGHKHICYFPTIRTRRLDIIIEESDGLEELTDISVIYAI